MKYVELKKHVLAGNLLPVYTLFGDDRFLLTYARKLFRGAVELPELNIRTFSGDGHAAEVAEACRVYPMMSKVRLVYYCEFTKSEPALDAYLSDPAPDTVLLLEPSAPALAKELCEKSEGIDCTHLDNNVLRSWIAQASGHRFSREASELLIAYTLSDLGRIDTEVQKLCRFCDGVVTEEAVRTLVTRDAEYKIYEMTQALFEGSPDKAYEMIGTLLREENPLALLKALYTQAHNMLFSLVSKDDDGSIVASFRVKPFALKYTRARARLYGPARLKTLCDYLADSEFRIKTGRTDPETALFQAVAKIVALRTERKGA